MSVTISGSTGITLPDSGALSTSIGDAINITSGYVSGIQLGGTGAANKLDDYEEGTWTPTVLHGTISSSATTYVKVGGLVTVSGVIDGFSDRTTNLVISISGLPFNTKSGQNGAGSVFFRHVNHSSDQLSLHSPSNSANLQLWASSKAGGYTTANHSHLNSASAAVFFTMTYAAT